MAEQPRCQECDAPIGRPSSAPCERCLRAWEWLTEESDRELHRRWWTQAVPLLREAVGEDIDVVIQYLTIVSWNENRVVTLAGWERSRRWFERRYTDVLKTVLQTDKDPVFVTPRAGANIARDIQREKEK